jgi:hypothetical protein
MEAICSSETSVATQQATRCHIPEDDTLHKMYWLKQTEFIFQHHNNSQYGITSKCIERFLWDSLKCPSIFLCKVSVVISQYG